MSSGFSRIVFFGRVVLALPLVLAAVAAPAAAQTVQLAALTLPAHHRVGMASWYGGHHQGRPTASGEIFSTAHRTAAHRTLPLGTLLRVTNLGNGRHCLVRINDRGPYVEGRVIDLSESAARDLGMINDGLAKVSLEVVAQPD